MMQISSKNDTHHCVMTSSLCIKNFKIDKFGDFSSEIDFNIKMDLFRDDISFIINQCDPRRPNGASGGHKVSASRAAQASEARLYYIYIYIYIYIYRVVKKKVYPYIFWTTHTATFVSTLIPFYHFKYY